MKYKSGAGVVTLVGLLMSGTAMAQVSAASTVVQNSGVQAADEEVKTVVVTGSRRTDVTARNSSVPIDVVRSDALANTGFESLTQSLRTLVPSLTYAETGGTIGSRLAKSATLRGLPAGDTLILVNGKRRALFARPSFGTEWSRGQQPVDLNAIPQSAIDHVEVLRDGASAQYGSDAVAGVINVVLRGNKPGGSLSVSAGQYYKGDGATKSVSGWHNFALSDKGFVTLSFDVNESARTRRDGPDTRPYYFAADAREADVDAHYEAQGIYGTPQSETLSFGANSEYNLTEKLTAYAFVTYSRRQYDVLGYPLRPRDDNNVRSIYPDGSIVHSYYTHLSADGAVGFRYDAGALGDFDFSTEFGGSHTNNVIHNATNSTYGANSPTDFYIGAFEQKQVSTQLDWVKNLPVSYSESPLTLSAGVAYRTEDWSEQAGDHQSYDSGGVPIPDGPNAGKYGTPGGGNGGIQPSDAGDYERNVSSLYVGLEQKLNDHWQFGIAGRYEDYSDYGNSFTGKFSTRYDFNDYFAVRGSVSTAFRAPTLAQNHLSSTSQVWVYPTGLQAYQATTAFLPVNNPVAQAFGASALEPETSKNYSLGFVARPVKSLDLAIDFYQIDIEDGIAPIEGFVNTVPAVKTILTSVGATNISSVRFFSNGLNTRTQGADFTARHVKRFDNDGILTTTFGLNVNKREVTSVKAPPASLAAVGLALYGRLSIGYAEHWAPDSKLSLGVNYAIGSWGFNADVVRYGEYKFTGSTATFDQTFKPQTVTNASISYGFKTNTRLVVGANNLFNTFPTKTANRVDYPSAPINGGARYNNFNNYDLQAPEGGNGGYYYARVIQNF